MSLLKSSPSRCQRFLLLVHYVCLLLCHERMCPIVKVLQAEAKTISSFLNVDASGSSLLFDFPESAVRSWEVITLKFLTPYRRKRDLAERAYHILVLDRPNVDSSIQIHVSKKSTLISPALRILVNDGGDREEAPTDSTTDTVFGGEVWSGPSSGSESVGSAALSLCHNNTGFCGLIITNDEHLLVQPHVLAGNGGQNPSDGIHHAVISIDASALKVPCLAADGVHVPIEKLRAAEAPAPRLSGAVMRHDAEDLEDVMSTLETVPANEPRNSLANSSLAMTAYAASGMKPRASASTKSRKHVVEIAVFTDEDFYNTLQKKFPSDTVKKLTDYVITIVNAMDLMYQHPSLGEQLEFSLVHLEIMKRYPPNLNKNNGKAMKYLSSFCEYAGQKNINGEMWDHALLLTGMDLHEDDTTATAGLAWAGTMCYRYYSCSVSEGTSFGAAYIITHEIGHSLGMEHDGMGISKSCDQTSYLMSPTTGPGKVEWSPCSRQNLKDFLQYGTAELRNTRSARKPTCLTMTSMRSAKKIEISEGNQPPGKKYNASMQCKFAMGNEFKPVLRKTEPPFHNICWMLYCGNGTHAVSTHPALEGTKCDSNKLCKAGKCVDKS